LTSRPWRSLKPCAFEVLIARVPSASLIPRGVGIATVVCRWRRRRTVHGHASSSTRHHGHRAAAVLQHCHLRVCRHDLHHALFAFLLLLALSCLHTLAAFALALLDLLDFTSVVMLVSFSKKILSLQSSHRADIPLFVHSFPFRKRSLDTQGGNTDRCGILHPRLCLFLACFFGCHLTLCDQAMALLVRLH